MGVKPLGEPKRDALATKQPAKTANEQVAMLPSATKMRDGSKSVKGVYTVESGDTLNKVAQRNGVSAADLKAANNLGDKPIRVGQVLVLPKAGKTAAGVSTPPAPAAKQTAEAPKAVAAEKPQVASYTPPQKPTASVQDVDKDDAAAPSGSGIGKMRWPVRGRVVQNYGSSGGKASDGIDIAVPEGTPVKAAENGVVIYAGDGLKEFGNTVLVRHENGLVTVYGHASALKVARGQKVTRGQEIAVSGMSGTTDSPKLHFEVRKNSAPVNPSTFLE